MKGWMTLLVGVSLLAGCASMDEQERALESDVDETSQRRDDASDAAPDGVVEAEAGPYCVTTKKETRCFPTREAENTYRLLLDRKWHPRADEISFIFYPEQDGSRFHVIMSAQDSDVARALQQQDENLVTLETDTVELFDGSRSADFSPHWGGAAVARNPLEKCTAGFTVNINGGGRGSVTAGHCFKDDEPLLSGPFFYGLTTDKTDPPFDVILIRDFGAPFTEYTNKIHVEPCCPTVRTVIGSASVKVGDSVCVSGQLHKAKCDLKVTELSGGMCLPEGCITDLIVAKKPGAVVAAPGDSGGPVYTRVGINNAVINGMLIGGRGSGDTIVAEKISNIETQLGVTVATTP
jgi:hypothetical protein